MRLSDIDLRLLRVFIAVAEAGGFAKAQEKLGISQPAISAQIAKLEDRLNLRLCNRGPQGFSLSGPGQNVLDEALSLMARLDGAAQRLRQIATEPTPQLRFGVVDCLITDPENPFVSALRDLRQKFPAVDVKIGIYDLLDCMTELRAGRIDMAIAGIALDEMVPDDLEAMPLYEEISSLFCAPDHPCASLSDPEDIKRQLQSSNISAYSFQSNPIEQELDVAFMDADAEIPQDAIEATAYLTLCGSHVGLIPVHYAEQWVKTGKMVRIPVDTYNVISRFLALRSKRSSHSDPGVAAWRAFKRFSNA